MNKLVYKLTIYDSYLLLPSKLSALALSFGLPGKKKFKHEDSNTAVLHKDTAFKQKLLEYNKHDVFLLYEILRLFNDSIYELFKMNI